MSAHLESDPAALVASFAVAELLGLEKYRAA